MSDLSPNGLAAAGKGVSRPKPRLLRGDPRSMLCDIVEHLWWNIERESEKDHPRSIHRKAQDILRVLPRWETGLKTLVGVRTTDLADDFIIYQELIDGATEVLNALAALVAGKVESHPAARTQYTKLHSLVCHAQDKVKGRVAGVTEPAGAGAQTVSSPSGE